MDDFLPEPMSPKPQPVGTRDTPLDVDVEEILDWDFYIDLPLDRNAEIIEVEVIDVGRERPLPFPDPLDETVS